MTDDPELVLVMPRRELFRASGLVRPPDIAVLAAIADDAWFAAPPAGGADAIDRSEVRVGVWLERPDPRTPQVLIDDDGSFLHVTHVPPQSVKLGDGLLMLRRIAALAGGGLVEGGQLPAELVGHLHDDGLPEIRGSLLMLYRLRAPAGAAAPAGMAWVSRDRLSGLPLSPLSALLLDLVAA